MGTYTCITCRIIFSGKDLSGGLDGVDTQTRAAAMQKEHYKTDWHRYNLKRKVADLPPVTAENFQERILAHKSQAAENGKDTSCRCDTCGKFFSTANSYTNHLQSKKHREMVAAAATDESKTEDSDAQVKRMNEKNRKANVAAIDKDKLNAELKRATQGAGAVASLSPSTSKSKKVDKFLSEVQPQDDEDDAEWEDVDGDEDDENDDKDVDYDVAALGVTHCLFCPQVSHSLETNISHMTVAHGFFIPDLEYVGDLEGLMSYLGEKVGAMRMCLWCNERSRVYTELRGVQQHMTDKGHCKIFHEGDAVLEYADFYDYRTAAGGDAAEDGEGDAEFDRRMTRTGETELDDTGFQMVLPSGCTVGHRTLQRYFRQKLRPGRELVLHSNPSSITKVMNQYKALGWLGTTGPAAVQKAKDIAYANRMRSRYVMNVGVKANKLQRHFRDDNFGIKT